MTGDARRRRSPRTPFRIFFIALCSAVFSFSCREDRRAPEASSDPDPAPASGSVDAVDPVSQDPPLQGRPLAPDLPHSSAGEIPVAEDFEEEASRSLALENLEAELDRLEAEIASLPN